MNKYRVEAFSDGVFAIVITLLILEIRIPEVDYSQLPQALVDLLPSLYAYIVSFGVIGTYWVGHHRAAQQIKRFDGVLIWINMLYLLTVSFMPIPTALLGRYPMQSIPIVIYGLTLIAANLTGLLSTLYLRAHPELMTSESRDLTRPTNALYVFVNFSYMLAILLGFVAPLASYTIFTVVLIVAIVVIAYYDPVPVDTL